MEIFIFSDLHSNITNLDLDYIHQFDSVIFAGDLLGYLILQPDVLDFFLEENIHYILGNHDLYFLRSLNERLFEKNFSSYRAMMIPDDEYEQKYGTLKETLEIISSYKLNQLYESSLTKRIEIDRLSIYVCHGSPINPFSEYLYPDSNNFDYIFNQYDFDILICGHTHIPFIKNKENRYIINPGSCTLPRRGLNPSFMTIKTNPLNIRLHELDQKIRYLKVTRRKIKLIE
ncbi:MAG: metallophosphoesterase family protein [Candidatus Kariarchaeaceae archaeon]|jgi:putative phosphoesterase